MKKFYLAAMSLLLMACSGESTSAQQESSAEKDGLKGKVHTVETKNYYASMQGGKIVKGGEQNPYGETDIFPSQNTSIYNQEGQLDSLIMIQEEFKYIYTYTYDDAGETSSQKTFLDGKQLEELKYTYQDGELAKTTRTALYGGEPSTDEFEVDLSKIKYENGQRIRYGYSEQDYTIEDEHGRILKSSAYDDMEGYLDVSEYTYNENGWRTSRLYVDVATYTYEYPEIDEQGNWTKMIIKSDGKPYGISERKISYHK